jgi:hypothetical protein
MQAHRKNIGTTLRAHDLTVALREVRAGTTSPNRGSLQDRSPTGAAVAADCGLISPEKTVTGASAVRFWQDWASGFGRDRYLRGLGGVRPDGARP